MNVRSRRIENGKVVIADKPPGTLWYRLDESDLISVSGLWGNNSAVLDILSGTNRGWLLVEFTTRHLSQLRELVTRLDMMSSEEMNNG